MKMFITTLLVLAAASVASACGPGVARSVSYGYAGYSPPRVLALPAPSYTLPGYAAPACPAPAAAPAVPPLSYAVPSCGGPATAAPIYSGPALAAPALAAPAPCGGGGTVLAAPAVGYGASYGTVYTPRAFGVNYSVASHGVAGYGVGRGVVFRSVAPVVHYGPVVFQRNIAPVVHRSPVVLGQRPVVAGPFRAAGFATGLGVRAVAAPFVNFARGVGAAFTPRPRVLFR